MFKLNLKKVLLNFIIVSIIFLTDRISKIYILKIAQVEGAVDIYLTTYLNFYLIWNKGVAFGLLSFEKNYVYNTISLIIVLISTVILVMITKSVGFKKYALIFKLKYRRNKLWN